jgi:ribosomal protein L10
MLMVKNSMARRATEGTPLAAAFEQMEGSLALVWGAEDIVSLAKEIARLSQDKQYESFEARGGVMEGAHLTAEQVKQVSKWPSREEQLSILLGQILSPGAMLASQLTSQGGALASQIEELIDRLGGDAPVGAEQTGAEATSVAGEVTGEAAAPA